MLDLNAMRESPQIQQALQLDSLGPLRALPPGVTGILDGLLVAKEEGSQALIVVMDGPLDVESIFQVAGAFGISVGAPEPEPYRDHQVWSIDLLSIELALSAADGSTTVSSSGAPEGGASAVDLVKRGLDSFDGVEARLMDDSNVARLINRLPSGVATAISRSCDEVDDLPVISVLEGCAGVGISVEFLARMT